jgi:TPR repeat protein
MTILLQRRLWRRCLLAAGLALAAPIASAQDQQGKLAAEQLKYAVELARTGKADAARAILEPKAETGDVEAQFNLALVFEYAMKRYPEAALWYRRAAVLGHPAAENNLGAMFYEGRGVRRSLDEALRWYRVSAERDHAPAQYNLGMMIGRAADQGNMWGQYYVGLQLKRGEGTRRNLADAVPWFEKSAAQGHVLAFYELAVTYELGLGVPADDTKALAYYRDAGERDHYGSVRKLTAIYADGGLGQKPDTKLARYWGGRLNAAAKAKLPEL